MKANYLASNAPPDMSARDWLRMLQTGLPDLKGGVQSAPEPAGTEVSAAYPLMQLACE